MNFPGDPVVKSLCCQGRRHGVDPYLVNKDSACHMVHNVFSPPCPKICEIVNLCCFNLVYGNLSYSKLIQPQINVATSIFTFVFNATFKFHPSKRCPWALRQIQPCLLGAPLVLCLLSSSYISLCDRFCLFILKCLSLLLDHLVQKVLKVLKQGPVS